MDGIINIYKEKGYTSHDVVAKMRGILRMRKIGHTGTLDPEAEGVLPVCLGAGTKLCDLLADRTKTYRTVLLLGQETDTQDTTGTVLARYPVQVTEEGVRQTAASFLGTYMQVPPMYSALKVNGKKLYQLARAGKEVERPPRPVEILALQVEEIRLPRVVMEVTCSKGTYIRTLCHDMGKRLGCGGCMESLVRTRVDRFRLEDSLTLAQLEALRDAGQVEDVLLPVDQVFAGLPGIRMETEGMGDRLVHNGNPFLPHQAVLWKLPEGEGQMEKTDHGKMAAVVGTASGQDPALTGRDPDTGRISPEFLKNFPKVRVYDSSSRFIGIYEYREEKGRYQPFKIFPGGS